PASAAGDADNVLVGGCARLTPPRALGAAAPRDAPALSFEAPDAGLAGPLAASPVGHLSDRIGPRRVLLVLTFAAGPAVLCYLAVGFFLPFAVTACVVGILQRGPALVALVASAEERVTARAHQQVVSNIEISLGAGAAGVALYLDTRTAYQALAYVGSAVVLSRFPVRQPPPAHVEKQPHRVARPTGRPGAVPRSAPCPV
ncbi:MFS transporter, partial [Kitasatospora sp. NPDC086801]|uniref:MFS transporter n=1 Tax=Kitasatospora sp. NPDC086801 TaxID=3364066 RepID=UPI00382DC08B